MAPSHTQVLAQIASMLRLFHVKVTVPADVRADNDKRGERPRPELAPELRRGVATHSKREGPLALSQLASVGKAEQTRSARGCRVPVHSRLHLRPELHTSPH